MVEIDYRAPGSVEEAVSLLASADKPARVLAGGTDLIIQLNGLVNAPHMLVDIKKIPEMTAAELNQDELILGPSMSCAEFTGREDISKVFPGLVESAYLIGSTQIQGRASIGGNLCNSSPAADTIPALIAVAAKCVVTGSKGSREVAVEDFVTGVGLNCMHADEMLTAIKIKRPPAGTADAYLRLIPRTEMDIAVAGAGVSVTLDKKGTCTHARVAIGAVAPTPLLVATAADALIGTKLDDAALQAASEAASAAASPINDRRGTIEYRTHVVGVLTKRAANIAAERARGN